MIKTIHIFDLDGTIIDSSHRQLYDTVSGKLNLDNWIENSSPEKVALDSLMPLAGFWRGVMELTNDYIMVCTARNMAKADYEFLQSYGLIADKIYSRPFGNSLPDHELKLMQIRSYLNLRQFTKAEVILYDDNKKVRDILRTIGIKTIHPKEIFKC